MPIAPRVVALLLFAAACGSVDEHPTTDAPPGAPDAAADAAPAIDAAPDAGNLVPMIDEVLAAQCGAYTPASGVGAGDDLRKVTLTNPDAVCNDGTRAVIYIAPRPAAPTPVAGFYQQGGGGCGTAGSCAIRYCGAQKYTRPR
ncbi:MAG: hypothetical protein IPH80_07260 [Myxococcales bacterium]|nr:hypothetical protein [Myxococcales bacterium]